LIDKCAHKASSGNSESITAPYYEYMWFNVEVYLTFPIIKDAYYQDGSNYLFKTYKPLYADRERFSII